jgi:hypothetical protein
MAFLVGSVNVINNDRTVTVACGTTAQRPASPCPGTIRLNSSCFTFEGFNGTGWVLFSGPETSKAAPGAPATILGESYCGGFYTGVINVSGTCYFLVIAPNATGCAQCQWKTTNTSTSGTGSCVNGYTNTYGPLDNATHPAGNWTATRSIDGFSDWYLPSRDELNIMYTNRGSMPAGETFAAVGYWSSNECSATYACLQNFSSGGVYFGNKTTSHRVRAVRRVPV